MLKLAFGLLVMEIVNLLAVGALLANDQVDESPQPNPYLHHFTSSGLTIELKDELHNPAFSWPSTLLTYEVDFSADPIAPGELVLMDGQTGESEPLQISDATLVDGKMVRAKVSFMSDLPSGGTRSFKLVKGEAAPVMNAVQSTQTGDFIEVDNGTIKVRIPKGLSPGDHAVVPGPIFAMKRDKEWLGESQIISPKHAVQSIQTERIESGPYFETYQVTYHFAGGGIYVAKIKSIAGYDFVQFDEDMSGLSEEDGIALQMGWKGFHPTQRMITGSPFGQTGPIDRPIVQPFRGEDPAFTGPSRIEDPSKEMLSSLTPYWPNGWGGNQEAAFWDGQTGQALGLFITDVGKWQDHKYAIWTSAETLKVKYRFSEGELYWTWPLVTGTRATGLTLYQHDSPPAASPTETADDEAKLPEPKALEKPLYLRVWYNDLSLNQVKDWVLTYPDAALHPKLQFQTDLTRNAKKTAQDYLAALPSSAMTAVTRGMFHPVALRDMGYWVVPGFYQFQSQMTPQQRSEATAYLLMAAYVSSEDEFSPMKTMLGGHPNFMGDLKYPMAAAASLFPEHPMSQEWRDQYAKFMELSGTFYVRPAVSDWQSKAGRFTESIATYNWAFLSPTTEANRLTMATGGRNVYAVPGLADMGDYLVGILTAPVIWDAKKLPFSNTTTSPAPHDLAKPVSETIPEKPDLSLATWPAETPLTWDFGFRRIHPPQGAHSSRRGAGGIMYKLGQQLLSYRPLTAEHLMWGSWPDAGQGFEDRARNEVAGPVNRGTNPHLTSAKYTGYGIVLRAGVDTPDEVSVYLQQIDKGPNYRWGYANQNGSGDIYYYARGKSFSGHEREEAGDGHVDDALFSCNTGVYKNWHFSSIGMNELTEPLYDLGFAQFAELVPDAGADPYSWPEYQSRSVMLIGTDYFIVYDHILDGCGTRSSWAISAGDVMPVIHHLRGADGTVNITDAKGAVRGNFSTMIKGGGSHMTLVTDQANVLISKEPRRAKGLPPLPYQHLQVAGGNDYVFENDDPVSFDDGKMSFEGTAGVIRLSADKSTQMAIFQGTEIGAGGVRFKLGQPGIGLSAKIISSGEMSGTFVAAAPGLVEIAPPSQAPFYVDGVLENPQSPGVHALSIGKHHWEMTSRLPEPLPPEITRTENHVGGGTILFSASAGATSYQVEVSKDNGQTWQHFGETADTQMDISGQSAGTKIHVRVIAKNADGQSQPGAEYPLYIESGPHAPPEGLRISNDRGHPHLTWGSVLGPKEYRLYRREKGTEPWTLIFHGLQNEYVDAETQAPQAFADPGLAAAADRGTTSSAPFFEYAISAMNGFGEGPQSVSVNTDPTSWLNWYPDVPMTFRRQSQFWLPPWVPAQDSPPEYYPK